MRKGSESCCRGSHGLVAAGGVDNVYSGRERDEAFFQPSGFLVVPVVEGGRVRDRLEVLTLRGDKIAARGGQGVNVADCVEGLSGDGADLVSVGFDPPFVAPREEALGGGDLACVVQRVQGGLRVGRVGGGCCGWRVGASGVMAASASAATRVAMRRARVFILLFPCGFLSLTGRIRKRLQDAQCPL